MTERQRSRLASNTALSSGTTFMGFTRSNEDDDEDVVLLMSVLVYISDSSVSRRTRILRGCLSFGA